MKKSERGMRKSIGRNIKIISHSESETMKIAAGFARKLRGGEVVLLNGPLGAGKSTFVRGVARAFGITEPVRSPTFTLMHVHKVKGQRSKVKNLVHIDAYRLKNADDLRFIGAEEFLGKPNAVTIIEWGTRIASAVRYYPKVIRLRMSHRLNVDERLIVIFKKNSRN